MVGQRGCASKKLCPTLPNHFFSTHTQPTHRPHTTTNTTNTMPATLTKQTTHSTGQQTPRKIPETNSRASTPSSVQVRRVYGCHVERTRAASRPPMPRASFEGLLWQRSPCRVSVLVGLAASFEDVSDMDTLLRRRRLRTAVSMRLL